MTTPDRLANQAAAEPLSELELLKRELHLMKTAGIIEVAVRNPSVAEYMEHWEGRALKAEAAEAAVQSPPAGGRVKALEKALFAIAAGCHRAKWSYEDIPAPTGTPSVFDFLHRLGDQAKEAALAAPVEAVATEPAAKTFVVGNPWKANAEFRDSPPRDSGALREALEWVETWISNPVGSYSVHALDGLFAMTRDRIRAALASGEKAP